MKTILNIVISFLIVLLFIFAVYIYSVNKGKTKNRLAANLKRGLVKMNIIGNALEKPQLSSDTGMSVWIDEPEKRISLDSFLHNEKILEEFKQKYFAKIVVIENEIMFTHYLPLILNKYILIPESWTDKITGHIELSGMPVEYKTILNDRENKIALLLINSNVSETPDYIKFNFDSITDKYKIGDKIEIIGFKNNAAYHQTIISTEIINEFNYKFLNNYILQQNFDKSAQYLAMINDNIVGIVYDGLFLKNSYLDALGDYSGKGKPSIYVMQFDLETSLNNTIRIGKNTVRGIPAGMIIETVNGYKIYNMKQLRLLIFDALIFGKKIMVNDNIDILPYIDFNVQLMRFADFECSADSMSAELKLTAVKSGGILSRFGIKTGDALLRINDIDVTSRAHLIELFYYDNLKIETVEIKTADNIIVKIKGSFL